jgi:Glu-tRNA(Gln) amidotransferase subunit E-like FAD-binding protein
VSAAEVERVRSSLPEILERRLELLSGRLDLPLRRLRSVGDVIDVFEYALDGLGLAPDTVLTALGGHLVATERRAGERPGDDDLRAVLRALADERIVREALPDIFEALSGKDAPAVEDLLRSYEEADYDVQQEVARALEAHPEYRAHPKGHAILMGILMEELRGYVDGRAVADTLQEALATDQ